MSEKWREHSAVYRTSTRGCWFMTRATEGMKNFGSTAEWRV